MQNGTIQNLANSVSMKCNVINIMFQSNEHTERRFFAFRQYFPCKCQKTKNNKTGHVRTRQHCTAFVQPLLQWKGNMYCIFPVCVAGLGTQHAKRKRHIVICGLSDSNRMFPHYLKKGTMSY